MSRSQTAPQSNSFNLSGYEFSLRSLPEVPSWVATLGRAGHAAKVVVYFIIGFLAFRLAIGAGGQISGSREAIREIGQQPFGQVLLGLIAIGLLGYTAWRWVQSAWDTEGNGKDAKGIVKRVGYLISGGAYLLLGIYAGSLALGMTGGQSDSGSGGTVSSLLDTTWGRVVLGIAGVIVVGVACYFVYKAVKAKFLTKYAIGQMSETARKTALHAGRMGLVTRGIAFAIIGCFIAASAWNGTSHSEVTGMEDALAVVASQAYGKFLLGTVGFGLMCYAVHMFLMAWYRRFNLGN